MDDTVIIYTDETAVLTPHTNDVFPSGCAPSSITIVTPPTLGTITIDGLEISYTPDDICTEVDDFFEYVVTCNRCACGEVTVISSEPVRVDLSVVHPCDNVVLCEGDCVVCNGELVCCTI